MTLPASGVIKMSDVNTELGYSSSTKISLNDMVVRDLAGISTGRISMSDLYGKAGSSLYKYNISGSPQYWWRLYQDDEGGYIYMSIYYNGSIVEGSSSYSATTYTKDSILYRRGTLKLWLNPDGDIWNDWFYSVKREPA